jgi:hypothetical protein
MSHLPPELPSSNQHTIMIAGQSRLWRRLRRLRDPSEASGMPATNEVAEPNLGRVVHNMTIDPRLSTIIPREAT